MLNDSGVIPPEFFAKSAAHVARQLIGMRLVRRLDRRLLSFTVTETEAYEGVDDLASHSSKGRTARTEIMFGPAGRFYIYRIYGLHWMLNIVTGCVGEGAAVLIRGVEGVIGPGRVAAALQIDASLLGKQASEASDLWFEYARENDKPRIRRTARIGVEYAGPIWANKKLRFVRI
jgi:DNA-3-methyladenine glycosylase